MYLLDTNVLSELRKASSKKANHNVIQWAKSISVSEMYISSITILEIEMGILKVLRKDPLQASIYRVWLNEYVLTTFAHRIISFDTDIALKCAQLQVPDPKSERDAMIAATSLVSKLTLITRNEKDFKHIDVNLINPWLDPPHHLRKSLRQSN
ncbi:MAG: type II toxin-antitoxin system VapC family toxin [Glaciecola sp.]|nr:type II toxin-antitoxin system VapC family toxin [Glaciecola sp.]MDG2099671.1 type II toxin-antitoxin system VapC family toxin [Glaciecola sp.]